MTSSNYYFPNFIERLKKNLFIYINTTKQICQIYRKEKKMKLDKILGRTGTILEVIAIFILIFKAKSMIVTTANWFEFMAIFTGLLIDLVYNKIK
jgi:hypothetical protein